MHLLLFWEHFRLLVTKSEHAANRNLIDLGGPFGHVFFLELLRRGRLLSQKSPITPGDFVLFVAFFGSPMHKK